MKCFTNNLFAIVLTCGLGVAGFSATAAASNQDSSPVFNAKNDMTFSGNFDKSSNYFSNPFNSSFDGKSSFATGSNGRDQGNFAIHEIQHPGTSDEYSQQWNSHIREFGKGGEDFFHHHDFRDTTSPVPEPSEYLFMACGLAMLYIVAKRRRTGIRIKAKQD